MSVFRSQCAARKHLRDFRFNTLKRRSPLTESLIERDDEWVNVLRNEGWHLIYRDIHLDCDFIAACRMAF
ncbi:hypothetical protein C2U72_05620 [Prosthecomicrobium hirschii]|nr:hypothetical protein C2U72_05620 [Prosthecomicrobium hirschii]